MNYKITQQERLLKELYRGKVNSYTATYSMRIKQAPVRILELKEKGYNIISIPKPDKSVDWILAEKMKQEKPVGYYCFVGNTAHWIDCEEEKCANCSAYVGPKQGSFL